MRSDNVTKGSERAPNRSLFYALGYTPEELERPLIGVVSAHSEIVPGHMNLDKIAEAVKAGVQMAGGTPILIPAIGVCDGIAMGHVGMKYSLASRELICDSVETMLMHMIEQNRITGTQVCIILIEQDVINPTENQIAELKSGSVSAFNFMVNLIRNLEITPAQLALDPYSAS